MELVIYFAKLHIVKQDIRLSYFIITLLTIYFFLRILRWFISILFVDSSSQKKQSFNKQESHQNDFSSFSENQEIDISDEDLERVRNLGK